MKAKYFAKEVAFVDKYGNNYAYLEDDEIINLYWLRDERAIAETDKKYRKYLFSVAYDILHNAGDCEAKEQHGARHTGISIHEHGSLDFTIDISVPLQPINALGKQCT